jgi:hypothetical protein
MQDFREIANKAHPLKREVGLIINERPSGAGGDPRKRNVKLGFDPKKAPTKHKDEEIKTPPERSQSVNGETNIQEPTKTGQYNQIDVESIPAVQGVNEKITEQINNAPNLSRSGIGQNLFPSVQDETGQQIGAPINPTDKMAGVSEQFNEQPLLKLLADNLFMTEATKQPVETGIDAIKDIGASNIVKTLMGPMGTAGELLNEGNIKGYDSQVTTGLQKGVISLAELGSVPFLALDNLVKQIPDVGENISGISQVPFVIMGETGKDVNKSIRDFLGFKLEDPEQEVLADEIAGVLAQFIIPAGIGKGFSIGTKGFKKLTEIKGIVESIPEPLRTTENIRKLLPEGIKERRIVDEKGNVTTEKVPTGDLTVDRLAESKENIKKNPVFTEDAPRITNTDAGIFDKGIEDNSFNIIKEPVTKKINESKPQNKIEQSPITEGTEILKEAGKTKQTKTTTTTEARVKPTFDKYLSDIMEQQGIKEIPNQSFVDSWKKQYEKKWGKEEVKSVDILEQEIRDFDKDGNVRGNKKVGSIYEVDIYPTKERIKKFGNEKELELINQFEEIKRNKSKSFQKEFQDRAIAGQLLKKELHQEGLKLKQNPDGSVTVYHGTSKSIAEKIRISGELNENTFFSHSKSKSGMGSEGASDYARIRGQKDKSGGEVMEVKVDPRDVDFNTGSGEFEATKKLVLDSDEIWKSAERVGKQYSDNVKIIKSALSNKNLDMFGLSKLSDITKPEVLKAVKEVAQYHISNNAKSFGDFARKMVKDVGNWIKPHLRKLWEETKKVFTGETALVDQNSMSVGIPKLNDKMSEPFSTAKEVKNDTPKGTEKSGFKPNEKTIHGDIKREIRDYLKTDLELMRELRRQKITDVTALEGGVKFGVKIAEELGGINYVKNLKEGSVFPIEQHLGIVGFATKTLKDALKNKDLPTVDRLEAFYSYYKAEAISGELGRSLRGRQLIPRLPIEDIKGIAKDLIESPDVPAEMKKQVKEMTEEIAKNPNVIKEPNWYDKAKYVLYNAMLSRPLTHARNMVGNTTHLAFEIMQNPNIGTLKGLNRGRKNIIPALKKVWNEGGDVSKFTEGVYEPKNKTVRNFMPTSWLKFEDIVFKELSKGMATEWQGKQLAKEKGIDVKTAISSIESVMQGKSLKGKEAMERISKAVDEIEEYAKFVTFQKDLGFRGQKFQSWIKSMPGSELIIPFIRTPANILKVGLQPLKVLKFVSPEYRVKFREMSPLMKRQELVRITAGTVAYVTLYELMAQGVIDITGQGADDKSKSDFMEAQGWKPNSIKIGSKYFSYQNINPFNVGLGLIGNYNDGLKYNYKPKDDKLNPVQKLSKTLAGFVQTTTDQSFLRGLSELSKWQEDENPYYLEGFVNALIPNILSVTKDVQTDETAYENKTLGDKVNSKIGGKNRPRINVFGDIEENSGTGLPFTLIPPKLGNSEKHDELSKMLLESNVTISEPKKFIKSNGEEATEQEMYDFKKESGQRIKKKLTESMAVLKEMTAGNRDAEVDRVVRYYRDEVKYEKFGTAPDKPEKDYQIQLPQKKRK